MNFAYANMEIFYIQKYLESIFSLSLIERTNIVTLLCISKTLQFFINPMEETGYDYNTYIVTCFSKIAMPMQLSSDIQNTEGKITF